MSAINAINAGAVFSPCGRYRYVLRRTCGDMPAAAVPLWVMLNPSTADAVKDDNTIRAVTRITKAANYKGFRVGNLYALRSRDPAALWTADDPIGPDNDYWLRRMAAVSPCTIAAWGAHEPPGRVARRGHRDYVERVLKLLTGYGPVYCLGGNANGSPKHPLFIKSDVTPLLYRGGRKA